MGAETPLGETKHGVLLHLLDGEATAEDLASKLAMNLSVARRHLEDLAGLGLVQAAFRRQGKGRPRKYYSITVQGRERISSRYDLVADLLTMAIAKDEGASKSRKLYASAGRVLAATVGEHQDPESLLPELTDFGFEPQVRKGGDHELIISRNCPVLKLAKKYPELTCDAFHTVFLREALKNPEVVLRQAIARGATECVHAT